MLYTYINLVDTIISSILSWPLSPDFHLLPPSDAQIALIRAELDLLTRITVETPMSSPTIDNVEIVLSFACFVFTFNTLVLAIALQNF